MFSNSFIFLKKKLIEFGVLIIMANISCIIFFTIKTKKHGSFVTYAYIETHIETQTNVCKLFQCIILFIYKNIETRNKNMNKVVTHVNIE